MAKRNRENEDDDEADEPTPFRVIPVSGPKAPRPSAEQVRLVGWILFGVVALVFAVKTFQVEEVRGDQIGFIVNNWTGEITEVPLAGNVVFCGLWNDFHTIENTNLSIDMGSVAGEGQDVVQLKTLDGNDVFVDFTIFYQMDPTKAGLILAENGAGSYYQRHWVLDYGRAIVRYVFGELTTEKFYVAEERDKKMRAAEKELNTALEAHGIRVTQLAVQSFRYHPDYEGKISEKKLSDQQVEEWRSKKAANEETQARRILQAEQEAKNLLTRFQGELDQKIESTRGESDKILRQAEGYAKKIVLGAEANFHKAKNEAEGLRVRLEAEAAGVRALRDAMAGDGGRNLVALEYAKRLAGLKVTGRPIVIDGGIQQFSHQTQQSSGPPVAPPTSLGAPAAATGGVK